MKIVLLKDVANVGRAGEVKEVADGYGRNFLLPKKLALLATPSALKVAEAQLQKEKEKEQRFAAEVTKLAQQLEGLLITFKEKASSEDHLYGSVRDSDIARELSQLTGLDIAKEKIELEEPIRQLGEYEVTVRFSQDLAPKIKVVVTREE
jgi:large subunit ribosomal protein L9